MTIKLALSGRLFEESRKKIATMGELREFVETAAQLGYEGVDLRNSQMPLDRPRQEVKDCAAMLADCGLEVVRMTPRGYPVSEDEALFERYLEFASQLGCRSLKMGGEADDMRRCADLAQRYSIKIGSQNHIGKEDAPGRTETIDRTVDYLEEINHPNFGLFYDPAHLFVSGSEYGPEAIRRISDKIVFVQIQTPVETDGSGKGFRFHGRCFTDGVLGDPDGPEFARVFRGLREVGYDGYICVFSPRLKERDSRELAELCHHNISELWESA